jgi:ABC-type molybdate transport system ATPase subunit
MERFLELIDKLEKDDTIKPCKYLSHRIDIVKEISHLADSVLITDDGHCDWNLIHILEDRHIYVFALEQDRFGWVIGGIPTTKGIITYG